MTPVTPERWSRVRQVFFAALDVDSAVRLGFVADACHGDVDLEQHVLRLLRFDEEAGSFLEQPAVMGAGLFGQAPLLPPPQLAQGHVLSDRFRIVSLIGIGGMGEVYEAQDDVLGDTVALKVIRHGVEDLEMMAARLRREAQLARKVTHGAVCRVHDVFLHHPPSGPDLLFLSMERLHGETLAEWLRHGEVSESQALDIAGQIAAGLDVAHTQGILHRDVKPENIFLERRPDGSCRAVLTDFGLAHRTVQSPADLRVTRTGLISGTPGYLAPEVLRGEPASTLSDLYAFGVVLRDMLVCVTPTLSTHRRAVLGRALDHDPRQRFPAARELVDALAADGPTRASHRWVRPTRWAAALVVTVALFSLAIRFYQQRPLQVAAASQILLVDMVNSTTEPQFDGVAEVLRSQLAQSPHFELLARSSMDGLLAQMRREPGSIVDPETAREVAMRAGVPLVVFSALTRLGQDYVFSVKLEAVGARPSLIDKAWTQTFTASSQRQVFEAVHDAAVWIRRMSGESASELTAQDRAPADTTTSSWEALQLFMQANAASAKGRQQDAALLLEQALRIDPEFATAQMRLGDILISLKRDDEGYAAWQRAIALAEQRQLTTREALRIRGQYFEDTGDFTEAEKAYRTYAIHYPNDFRAAFFLGSVLVERDRGAEAIGWFEKAKDLQPSSTAAYVHLALEQLDLGQTAAAEANIARLDALNATDWAQWLRALARFATGDADGAFVMLDPLRSSADDEWRSRASTIRASWLAERGDEAAAIAELHRGIDVDAQRNLRDREADKWLHLADLQVRAGDRNLAMSSAQRALQTASSVRRVALVGRLMARAGDVTQARLLLDRLNETLRVPRTEAARLRLSGELNLMRGDAKGAIDAFERAFQRTRRRESRMPLVRAYLRSGDADRAEAALTQIVAHPVRIYAGPEPESPGLWRQALVDLLRLIEPKDALAATRMRDRYHQLLRTASNDLSVDPKHFPQRGPAHGR